MDRKRLIDIAAGRLPADVLLKNAQVIDVFGHRVIQTNVALCGGLIAGLGGGYLAREVIDLGGRYLSPGLIDAHIHIESSMLTPPGFACSAAPHGTSLCVCDPHEIANVMGLDGIRLLAGLSIGLPVEFRFTLPSCVPASPLETSGFELTAADLFVLAGEFWVAGLGEVMNFPGVVAADPDLLAKLGAVPAKPVDGHAPGLSGPALAAYLACGISSDHECTTLREAQEKLSAGCHIMLREGSTARNLRTLMPLARPEVLPRLMLVSDDLGAEDLLQNGHLDRILRRGRALGADPLSLIRMVTINPALYFGLERRGAVAPGWRADFCVFDNLDDFGVSATFLAGRQTSRDGELLAPAGGSGETPEKNTMRLSSVGAEAFHLPHRPLPARIIELSPGQIVTGQSTEKLPERGGGAAADPSRDIVKLAVIERHGRTNPPNVGLAFVRGLGLRRGAIASSVAHDSHNLIVAGVDDADMALAANSIIKCGGGQVVVAGGRELACLPLPVAGLMSTAPASEIARRERALGEAAASLGCGLGAPFMALSFLALPVIPALKLTDRGLVDTALFEIVSPWAG
ncbi:MAG: adenine deaminase [Pseudomonadota bacterium]